ncbi:hypothetical protein CALVIDRAFT_98275 [Calocera viscosa TUFC12733]|uniref:Uncharacterized protein n=1 Tax=Calocera viscosa (strain TUFC12733) TaxID=1330018 RepID=A0A167MJW5_CALVF|nr:hypothetical protein CALVIDRAFT_98275 [Calocera viscosa TUFC12733]
MNVRIIIPSFSRTNTQRSSSDDLDFELARRWRAMPEYKRSEIAHRLLCMVPGVMSEFLDRDNAIWQHPATWAKFQEASMGLISLIPAIELVCSIPYRSSDAGLTLPVCSGDGTMCTRARAVSHDQGTRTTAGTAVIQIRARLEGADDCAPPVLPASTSDGQDPERRYPRGSVCRPVMAAQPTGLHRPSSCLVHLGYDPAFSSRHRSLTRSHGYVTLLLSVNSLYHHQRNSIQNMVYFMQPSLLH